MTPAEFKARFPEFTSTLDARIQFFIDDAAPHFNVATWDDFYPAGIANFVAHELTMADVTKTNLADAGNSLSSKVGDVSETLDTMLLNKQAGDPFLLTKYGQKYRYLQRMVGPGALAV